MHIPKKYIQITAIILGVLLFLVVVAGIIGYSKRQSILSAAIAKGIRKAKTDYGLNVTISSARFNGLRTVDLSNISVIPDNRDSLAFIKKLSIGVKLLPLLLGDVKLAHIQLYDGKITLVKKGSLRNYDFLFRKKSEDKTQKTKINYAELADNLLNKLLNKIPDDMDLRNFKISFTGNKEQLIFNTTSATIVNGNLKSNIEVNNGESTWHLQGKVEPGDKNIDVRLFAENKKVELPIIEQRFKLKLNFDTIQAQLKSVEHDGNDLQIKGSYAVKNLLINHAKLAANDIIVPDGEIDADFRIGENFLALDSSSVIHLKNVTANPYLKFTLKPKKIYELKVHTGDLDAQQLFNSFPRGLFESLEGIKVVGKLQYDLNFYFNTSQPDSVQFDSRLNKKDFKIVQWGKNNLQKINDTFVYTPYEFGKPMRDIIIGPANPNFTPLNEISPNLRNALLTAEDPSFYTHHGFVEKSIRRAIATDFKEKAFKRGASTISMQLVKNVYLNRQKTLARKIEETMIVWLIESNKLSTKQRMFEVYLNLIEWGRNVYGIGEASKYYFGKRPSEITLGEGIFLASIVPRPKKGLYFFEPDGSLRQGLHGYFRLIGNLMARKGMAQPDSNAYGFYSVRLKESLRQAAAPTDTVTTDSLMSDDEDGQMLPSDPETLTKKVKKLQDSVNVPQKKTDPRDSVKTPADLRKEKREQRRKERDERDKRGY